MYLQKKFGFGLLAVVAGLIASTSPLSAQQVYKATFDLPFAAHWGGTDLEPGAYTVTVEQGLATKVIRVRGEGATALTFAIPSQIDASTEQGRLTFRNVGGTYVIEQFDAGSLGQSFTFAVPKALHGESARGGEKTPDTVVVSTR
jgi:hypothetical protein